MFERFTERAQEAIVLAQDEARSLGHGAIDTEHLLLGIMRKEDGLGARALDSLGLELDDVRARVVPAGGEGGAPAAGAIPFSPGAKKVLELSLREALALNHKYIGTEHMLLGLVREEEGLAGRILLELGADANRIREATLAMLDQHAPPRRRGWRRRSWDYNVVPVGAAEGLTEDLLAPLGAAGWELVAVVGEPGALRAVLKRPA